MREASNAFGYPGLIVEKLIERGRHIEVQIAGDGKGNVIHLFERECSLQRRHQKLIEEAPAANLPAALRDRMLADAVRLGERLNYRGVGTVEFILSADRYYFLEVNPRLQVEHPVTEMVTGIDIVETMLRIAAGEGLPLAQRECVQRPCRRGATMRGGSGQRLSAVLREARLCQISGRRHSRRDRRRERIRGLALLQFNAGQADTPGPKPATRRSTGWGARSTRPRSLASRPTRHFSSA